MVKDKGYHRSWPNKHSFGIWWSKYQFRQRLARRAPWDMVKWDSCVSSLRADLAPIRLTPLPPEHTPHCFTDLTASAGIGLEGKKEYANKGEIPIAEISSCYRSLAKGQLRDIPDYSIAFRSHLVKKGDEPKSRVVLVSPGPLAMVEKCFADPLYRAMRATRYPKPWASGFDWFRGDGSRILQTFGDNSLSIDFSSFDLCAPVFMIKDVFHLIRGCFDCSDEQDAVLSTICHNHTSSWVRRGGKRYHMTGGIRTGSSLTHIIGTLICVLMVRYLTELDVESISFGDDVVMNTTTKLRVICDRAQRSSSFSISTSKSKKGVHWLGLHYTKGRWEVENDDRRWGQLFYPEHIGADSELQVKLLHAHLLAAGSGRMAADLRTIIRETGHTTMTVPTIRSLKRAAYIPATDMSVDGRSVLTVEARLKFLLEGA